MTTPSLLDKDEVVLFDQRFKIAGPVQESLVSVFPGKIVIGDATRADDPLASSYVMTDWTGGLLKRDMLPAVDFDRFRWSDGATWFSRQLTLGPAVGSVTLDAGQVTTLSGKHVRCGATYLGFLWVAWDDQLARVNSDGTVTLLGALPGVATSMLVYRSATTGNELLYIGCGSDNAASCDGATITDLGVAMYYLAIWDDKLVAVSGNLTTVSYCTDDGATFTSLGSLPYASGATGLLIYPDANGEDALHLCTTQGLFFYDDSAGKIRPTKLGQLPRITDRGKGSTVHQDNLYFTGVGLEVLRYTGSTVSSEGFNRDDGLPADYRGTITQLASSLNYLVAAVETLASSALGDPVYGGSGWYAGGGPAWADVFAASTGFSTIYLKGGTGWHTLYSSSQKGTGCKWVGLASVDNVYRLWFGIDGSLSYIDLNPDVANLLENSLQEFRQTATLQAPFNDMGWTELDKLAMDLDLGAERLGSCVSGTPCHIDVYYALEGDENTWTLLGTADTNTPDPMVFGVASEGLPFKRIAFKYVLTRCDDVTHTPVLKYATLRFIKALQPRWGYRFTVDCTQDGYGNLSSPEQVDALKALIGTVPLGTFKATVDGVLVEQLVKLVSFSGNRMTGNDGSGLFTVSVVAL